MIIDAHAHYTTAPPQLQAYRGQQITNLARPVRPRLQVSDEQLERSMQNQFKRMQDSGIDRILFSPQASAMGHHFGTELYRAATGPRPVTTSSPVLRACGRTKSHRCVSCPSHRGSAPSRAWESSNVVS